MSHAFRAIRASGKSRGGSIVSFKLALAAAAVFLGNQAAQTHANIIANIDLETLTAAEIEEGYATGAYTPTDIAETYAQQIATYNPVYDAYEELNPDFLQ